MKYLSEYMNDAQSAAFAKFGAFFAFSQSQFSEHAKNNVEYTQMGAGLICPSSSVKALSEELENILQKAIDLDVNENGAEGIIEREYFNHECQITGSTRDAVDSLSIYLDKYPDQFTKDTMDRVFKCCFNKAVENDWF